MRQERLTCQHCRQPFRGGGYWRHPITNRKVQRPFCDRCYEDLLRRHIREEFDAEIVGPVWREECAL